LDLLTATGKRLRETTRLLRHTASRNVNKDDEVVSLRPLPGCRLVSRSVSPPVQVLLGDVRAPDGRSFAVPWRPREQPGGSRVGSTRLRLDDVCATP
jgi:hypothetical protein